MEKLIEEFKDLDLREKRELKGGEGHGGTGGIKRRSGLVYHVGCEDHFSNAKNPLAHVENPFRVSSPMEYLDHVFKNILDNTVLNNFEAKEGKMEEENQGRFVLDLLNKFEEIDLDHVRKAHGEEYVDGCINAFETRYQKYLESKRKDPKKKKPRPKMAFSEGDMFYSHGTTRAMGLSAEGTRIACQKIINGHWHNAFVLTRPPGHHARFNGLEKNPGGFCFFNNVAIGARYLQSEMKGKFQLVKGRTIPKVVIFDWDVHHGDGTQDIFKECSNTLYISMHQYEHGRFYPGGDFGGGQYIGVGKGEGYNCNVGWNLDGERTLTDQDYFFVFEKIVKDMVLEFDPDFVLVSAGFDSCRGDKLGGFDLSYRLYYNIVKSLQDVQERIVVALEGGYTLENLKECSFACISALLGLTTSDISRENLAKEFKSKRDERAFVKNYRKLIEDKNYDFSRFDLGDIVPQEFCIEVCIDLIENQSHFYAKVDWDGIIENLEDLRTRRKHLDRFRDTIGDNVRVIHMDTVVFSVRKQNPEKLKKKLLKLKHKDGQNIARVDFYHQEKALFHLRLSRKLNLRFREEDKETRLFLSFEGLEYEDSDIESLEDAKGGKWLADKDLISLFKIFG